MHKNNDRCILFSSKHKYWQVRKRLLTVTYVSIASSLSMGNCWANRVSFISASNWLMGLSIRKVSELRASSSYHHKVKWCYNNVNNQFSVQKKMGRRARNEAKVCRIALLYQATSILPNLLDVVSIQHANLGIDVPSIYSLFWVPVVLWYEHLISILNTQAQIPIESHFSFFKLARY